MCLVIIAAENMFLESKLVGKIFLIFLNVFPTKYFFDKIRFCRNVFRKNYVSKVIRSPKNRIPTKSISDQIWFVKKEIVPIKYSSVEISFRIILIIKIPLRRIMVG